MIFEYAAVCWTENKNCSTKVKNCKKVVQLANFLAFFFIHSFSCFFLRKRASAWIWDVLMMQAKEMIKKEVVEVKVETLCEFLIRKNKTGEYILWMALAVNGLRVITGSISQSSSSLRDFIRALLQTMFFCTAMPIYAPIAISFDALTANFWKHRMHFRLHALVSFILF